MDIQLGEKCFVWTTVAHERLETICKLKDNNYIARIQTNKRPISESKQYKTLIIARKLSNKNR